MSSEHKRIVDRLEALESNISGLRRNLDDHHHASLEARLGRQLSVLGKRADMARDSITGLEKRLFDIEARLARKPDDFGGVTSTGAQKRMKRWIIAKGEGLAFSREYGFVRRDGAALPVFFQRPEDSCEIIERLGLEDAFIEAVDVIERDGMLVEARYA